MTNILAGPATHAMQFSGSRYLQKNSASAANLSSHRKIGNKSGFKSSNDAYRRTAVVEGSPRDNI